MLFPRLAATFLFILTFGMFALATPTILKHKTSIELVLDALEKVTAPILAAINTTSSTGTASLSSVEHRLFTELNVALDTVSDVIKAFSASEVIRRADQDAIFRRTAEILTNIVATVNTVADVDGVKDLLPGLDTALSGLFETVQSIVGEAVNTSVGSSPIIDSLLRGLSPLGLFRTLATLDP